MIVIGLMDLTLIPEMIEKEDPSIFDHAYANNDSKMIFKALSHRNSNISFKLGVGQTFQTKFKLINIMK